MQEVAFYWDGGDNVKNGGAAWFETNRRAGVMFVILAVIACGSAVYISAMSPTSTHHRKFLPNLFWASSCCVLTVNANWSVRKILKVDCVSSPETR